MKRIEERKILFYILRNLVFYLFLMGLATAIGSGDSKKPEGHNYSAYFVITTFYLWGMIHNSLLLEKLLLKKKYLLYVLSVITGFALIVFTHYLIASAYMTAHIRLSVIIFENLFYTCIAVTFYLAYKYMMERKTFYQLHIMQRDIELQQLRSHLNPHFLFNALNNIYSYTLQHNRYGDELILKLSELMRFIIDCSEKNRISLKEELGFINNYIVFEKERLGERCTIHLNQSGEVNQRQIAPLILFPFIENACKYGADTIQRTEIDITIENLPACLKMTVKNSIVNTTSPSTKTGLYNAVRRLELLYPEKHEVLITTDENKFSVELTIQYNEA